MNPVSQRILAKVFEGIRSGKQVTFEESFLLFFFPSQLPYAGTDGYLHCKAWRALEEGCC